MTAPGALSQFVQGLLDGDLPRQRIADAAKDPVTGESVGRTWLGDLAAGRVRRFPELYRLRAIAAAARLRYPAITDAEVIGLAQSQWPDVYSPAGASRWPEAEIARTLVDQLPSESLRRLAVAVLEAISKSARIAT